MTPAAHRMQGVENANTEPMPFRSPNGPAFSDGFSFGSMSNSSPIVQEKSWDNTMLALCSLVQEQGADTLCHTCSQASQRGSSEQTSEWRAIVTSMFSIVAIAIGIPHICTLALTLHA